MSGRKQKKKLKLQSAINKLAERLSAPVTSYSYTALRNLEKALEAREARLSSVTSSSSPTTSPSSSSATSSPYSPSAPSNPKEAPYSPLTRPQNDATASRLALNEVVTRLTQLDEAGFRETPATQELFATSNNLPTEWELDDMGIEDRNAEMIRYQTFLNDTTSTPEGAKEWSFLHNLSFYKGAFGNQWEGTHYDESRVDKALADEVFSAYRKISERKEAYVKLYGSENLILELYSWAVMGENYLEHGMEKIDQFYLEYNGFSPEADEMWEQEGSPTLRGYDNDWNF